METITEIGQVIEILPNGRYALVLDRQVPIRELEYIRTRISQWQMSGDQFLIINGGVKLVRVDKEC